LTPLSGVLDAAVVIAPAKGGVFALLRSLYASLHIPTAVRQEILTGQGRAGEQELSQALGVWITEVTTDPGQLAPFSPTLSLADREVPAVAATLTPSVDHLLADDKDLLREADRHGLTWLRTPDLVVLMKRAGLVPAVRPVLDQMQQRGYGIAADLYNKALRAAGEGPS
jgi:predicted nucleic acid-binding protein